MRPVTYTGQTELGKAPGRWALLGGQAAGWAERRRSERLSPPGVPSPPRPRPYGCPPSGCHVQQWGSGTELPHALCPAGSRGHR